MADIAFVCTQQRFSLMSFILSLTGLLEHTGNVCHASTLWCFFTHVYWKQVDQVCVFVCFNPSGCVQRERGTLMSHSSCLVPVLHLPVSVYWETLRYSTQTSQSPVFVQGQRSNPNLWVVEIAWIHFLNWSLFLKECVLNYRLEPLGTVEGFTAEVGASGSFCPSHLTQPVEVSFYSVSDDNAPSPYMVRSLFLDGQ